MTKKEQVKVYLIDNPDTKLTIAEIANKFDCGLRTVDQAKFELKNGGNKKDKEPGKEKTIDEKIDERRENGRIKMLEKQNRELFDRYETLMNQYEEALLIKEQSIIQIPKIKITNSISSQAVPVLQFSDWHCEEKIERSTTHGLNEFNPDIAEKRVTKLAENTLKLIKKERQDTKINELVICLGGDFINNFLHEHDVQMNFMSPIDAVVFAKYLLSKSLSTIAHYGNFKRIVIICIRGNHGRITKRMQSGNDYKMNYEALIYNFLKQELNDSLFEWHIPESQIGYIDVYDKKIRAFHGHEVNFQGGVGDITIPVNKFVMKQDKTTKADWNLMHHYHRYWQPSSNVSLNGSLCGWNSYALSCGFQYEPPLQVFHLLDSKRGFTVRTPIHCE